MPDTQQHLDDSTNSTASNTSPKESKEFFASEEYAAIPEHLLYLSFEQKNGTSSSPTFHQRKYDLFERLKSTVRECEKRFSGTKELASEEDVAELCETLEAAFQYGLKQQQPNFVVSAASLFQNMQEIVIGSSMSRYSGKGSAAAQSTTSGNDAYFWDFCKNFLIPHEKERFDNLKQVWTKMGKGRAFIRASLNEHSLERYLLTWLSERHSLASYYANWSLLMDEKLSRLLPEIIKTLDNVLFALPIDKTELNASSSKPFTGSGSIAKEEPVIYAPPPVTIEQANKPKRKCNIVERPIANANSTEDLINNIASTYHEAEFNLRPEEFKSAVEEFLAPLNDTPPPDPIGPELEFLEEPLYFETRQSEKCKNKIMNGSLSLENTIIEIENNYVDDDKSDTSSQYSKTSSSNIASAAAAAGLCQDSNHAQLEEQLKEINERCCLLDTRVAQLQLENRQLIRRLKKHFEDSGIDPSSSFATNFLITIPHVKLEKPKHATASSYYLYEIHITMRQNLEHWSLWRRYSDFNKLHKTLLKTHASVISSVEFPPKKRFGNMNIRFVEERRQQLQIYLLNLVESLHQVEVCKTKAELQKVFPFLRERR